MRRLLYAFACLIALLCGILIPVVAFGEEGGAGSTAAVTESATSAAPTTTGATSTNTPATGGTTGTTTPGDASTGVTTGGADKGTTGTTSHQARTELLAALASFAIFVGILFGLNRAVVRTAHAPPLVRTSSSGGRSLSKVVERSPVLHFLLLGDDGRWALSKTLASVWTAVIVWAIATLALSDLFGAKEGWEEFAKQGVSWQYLLLLGGPVAASISAQALTLIRSQSGVEVKTEPPDGASLTQLYSDDWGKLELIDVQYLAFNCLSIVVFLVVFVANVSDGLPVFPEVLAALTAATAGGYVARRAAMRANPSITSISPPAAAAGELVQLWGVNLTPAREHTDSSVRHQVEIFFDGLKGRDVHQASKPTSDLHEAYKVRVPVGAAPKDGVQVIVNSGGERGLKSEPYTDFKVLAPALIDIEPPRVSPGTPVTLRGSKLLADGGGDPRVFFGDLAGGVIASRQGKDDSQDILEVKVPELAAGAVKVRVVNGNGQPSNELDLKVTADVRIVEAPEVLSLGPDTPSLLLKGQGFVTQPGPPLLAAVYLDGHPLTVDEGKWGPGEVTAKLPTSPDELKRLGFATKDDAQLIVRNDQGHSSEPWPLKLTVAAAEAS